jgi:LuxR family maltose regulon positive regulatory protein
VRTFTELGRPLAPLLREVAIRQPGATYPRRLLAAIERATPVLASVAPDRGSPAGWKTASEVRPTVTRPGAASGGADGLDRTAAWRAPGGGVALAERLTYREEEVLRCLVRRLSNKEIARELGISLATVKRHASHVYAKLGVGTRREAERRTRELGLLSASA